MPTPALDLQPVFTAANTPILQTATPFATLTNGRTLAAYETGSVQPNVNIIASDDEGATWSQVHQFSDTNELFLGGMLHFPENIALVAITRLRRPGGSFTNRYGRIYRSTDGGSTWTQVENWNVSPDSQGGAPLIAALCSFGRTGAVAVGHNESPNITQSYTYSRSTDKGQTWSRGAIHNTNPDGALWEAITNVGSGLQIASHQQKFYNASTNAGSTWGGAGTLPGFSGADAFQSLDNMSFSPSVIILAGSKFTIAAGVQAALYKSTNGGSSWTAQGNSIISNYPTHANGTVVMGLKRLTTFGGIISLGPTLNSGLPPWRLTMDQGDSYNIQVTTTGVSWASTDSALGAPGTTKQGWVLAWARNGSTVKIYRGRPTC